MPKILKVLLLSFSLFTIHYSLFTAPATAQQEFTTRFNSTYTVSAAGITTVIHQIEITNKLAGVYASEYALTIGSTRVKNVSASSATGAIETSVATGDNSTHIKLVFSQPTVGKNQTLRFTVSYANLDIATKSGRVLEVNIPRISNVGQIDDYDIVVTVPDSFDTPTIISPPAASLTNINQQQVLRYTKNQLTQRGISILFGDHQAYDFTLRYTLQNPGVTKTTVALAIPPDTAYQKMFYDQFNPPPQNVTVDPDGNWLAHYPLKAGATKQISVSGQAILYLEPLSFTPPADPQRYLATEKFWPVSDPSVVNLAGKLKTPENIYNYIVDNLTYNYSRIDASTTRLGAKAALDDPQNAICTEFTDLFVTLARAAGIPARSQDGFAFTANSQLRPLSLRLDVLHAWPEYYDQKQQQWIPVDPTWGNTTGGLDYFSRWDLNHFTFAIHGSDSITPYPAGAYKLASTQGKDVNVAFSLTSPQEQKSLDVSFTKSSIPIPILPQEIKVTIKNTGNTSLTNAQVEAVAPGYNIIDGSQTDLSVLPPQATANVNIKLENQSVLPANNLLKVIIEGQEYQYEISPSRFSYSQILYSLSAIALGGIFAFAAYTSGSILVQKLLRRNSLHRQSPKPPQ